MRVSDLKLFRNKAYYLRQYVSRAEKTAVALKFNLNFVFFNSDQQKMRATFHYEFCICLECKLDNENFN